MEFFEPFWDSGEPRAGEKGARGWRAWMHQQERGGWVAVGPGEAPPRGGFRFPGVLMCAGGSSETQERYTDPGMTWELRLFFPRHLKAAPTSPAKKSGKSTQGACAPFPRCPARRAPRRVRSGFAHAAAAHFRLCLLSSLHLSRVRLQAAPPRSHCRALPPSLEAPVRPLLPAPPRPRL